MTPRRLVAAAGLAVALAGCQYVPPIADTGDPAPPVTASPIVIADCTNAGYTFEYRGRADTVPLGCVVNTTPILQGGGR